VKGGDQRKLVGATLVRRCSIAARTDANCIAVGARRTSRRITSGSRWGSCRSRSARGARARRRVHIFWQRRINDGDTVTPYWYPSMTNQGAIREDRLVFPIPPGTHWTEVQAISIPRTEKPALDAPRERKPRTPKVVQVKGPPTTKMHGLRFAPRRRRKARSRSVGASKSRRRGGSRSRSIRNSSPRPASCAIGIWSATTASAPCRRRVGSTMCRAR
jgi:hypothetical protein